MDTMMRTAAPQQLLTMLVPAPPVITDNVTQVFKLATAGYVWGGMRFDEQHLLFFQQNPLEQQTRELKSTWIST